MPYSYALKYTATIYIQQQPVVKKVKLPTDEEYYDTHLKEIRKFVKYENGVFFMKCVYFDCALF